MSRQRLASLPRAGIFSGSPRKVPFSSSHECLLFPGDLSECCLVLFLGLRFRPHSLSTTLSFPQTSSHIYFQTVWLNFPDWSRAGSVAQVGLELMILLPQPLRCLGYRPVPPSVAKGEHLSRRRRTQMKIVGQLLPSLGGATWPYPCPLRGWYSLPMYFPQGLHN